MSERRVEQRKQKSVCVCVVSAIDEREAVGRVVGVGVGPMPDTQDGSTMHVCASPSSLNSWRMKSCMRAGNMSKLSKRGGTRVDGKQRWCKRGGQAEGKRVRARN